MPSQIASATSFPDEQRKSFPVCDHPVLLARETRFDFGCGVARCGDCRSFPHKNRGCRSCSARLCKGCASSHICCAPSCSEPKVVAQKPNIESNLVDDDDCNSINGDASDDVIGCEASVNRQATMLPPRKLPTNSRYTGLLMERQKTLGSKNLWEQVQLPQGASENEWLAINTIDFFNELNLLTGALSDICTDKTCPCMSAGSYSFAWCDGQKFKVPTKMSAPEYCEHLLVWVEGQLADESFLPTKHDSPFPAHYRKGIAIIYRRLFRIYAHTFHSHFKHFVDSEADAHLSHSFKHFIYFVKEFDLVPDNELEPLQDLITLCLEKRSKEQ